jgi:uncharacterized membrane protein YidH (DUF202 family)
MPSPEGDERGLARERTGLAWERSALAFGALGAVVLGVAAHRDLPILVGLSAALGAVGAVVWRHGRQSYDRPFAGPQTRALLLMSLVAALTAVAAAAVMLAR